MHKCTHRKLLVGVLLLLHELHTVARIQAAKLGSSEI